MSTILYISGPMTGLPELNYPKFNEVERRLIAAGFVVLNPARHGSDAEAGSRSWADFMRLAMADVCAAHGVATLHAWHASRGATLEVHVAAHLGIPVRPADEWLRDRIYRISGERVRKTPGVGVGRVREQGKRGRIS